MNRSLTKISQFDFEEFGYRTMQECGDETRAIRIVGLHLHAYEDALQPELHHRNAEIAGIKSHSDSLHSHLYNQPVPVNDAKMVSHGKRVRILLAFTVLAAIACLVGNMTSFFMLGLGLMLVFFSAVGLTALPLIVGHPLYEWIISKNRLLQISVILVSAVLTGAGILTISQARSDMVDRAISIPTASSFINGEVADNVQTQPPPNAGQGSEANIRHTFGEGMLLVMLAAELALGFFVGLLIHMITDEDFASWRKLKKLTESIIRLEHRIAEILAMPEIAKKQCLAGILRAQSAHSRRHPPYHRALTLLLILGLALIAHPGWAQTIERYEGILIDTSASISRGDKTNELFHEYLIGSRKLLLTEPPNSRVSVTGISTDSFGGTREILNGWTPDARGVFTDDLNRARRQLASTFDAKSSGIVPVASGTDIFGALWRIKTMVDFGPAQVSSSSMSKTIWIFSDMMNDTKAFPMPEFVKLGPQRMLERAKANGQIIPLIGYRVHVYGASTKGLSPPAWMAIKRFWDGYFDAAGAKLVSYSSECEVAR